MKCLLSAVLAALALSVLGAGAVYADTINEVKFSVNEPAIHVRSNSTEKEIQDRIRNTEGAVSVLSGAVTIDFYNTYLLYWDEDANAYYGVGTGEEYATPFRSYAIGITLEPEYGDDWPACVTDLEFNTDYKITELDDFNVYTDQSLRLDAQIRYNDFYHSVFITLPIDYLRYKNTLTAAGKTAIVRYSRLKKKTQTVKRSKAISVKKPQGKVTYELVSVRKAKYTKYFKVNKKTGNFTVKRGLPKGTYKVKVRVRAAGTPEYYYGSKKVTATVKVK